MEASTSATESPKMPRFDLPHCAAPAYCGVCTWPADRKRDRLFRTASGAPKRFQRSCRRKQHTSVIRSQRYDCRLQLRSVLSAVPDEPLSGGEGHPYSHALPRVATLFSRPVGPLESGFQTVILPGPPGYAL